MPRSPREGVPAGESRDSKEQRIARLPRGLRVASRLLALIFIIAASGFFAWGIYLSGRVVFVQSVSAEDVTRGYDFGPIWVKGGTEYRARLSMIIPEGGKFWETVFSILDSGKVEVGKETVFLAITEPAFEEGKLTVRDSFFSIRGSSGWHYFRFKQVGGTYPSQGAMGFPAARLELREGVVEPKLCWVILIVGWIIGIILFSFSL